MVQSGNLALDRDPNNGLTTGTALEEIKTTHSHTGFGELSYEKVDAGTAVIAQVTPAVVSADLLNISGTISGASVVEINNIAFSLDSEGGFSGTVPLPQTGYNELVIKIFDTVGDLMHEEVSGVNRQSPTTNLSILRLLAVSPSGDAYLLSDQGILKIPEGTSQAVQIYPDATTLGHVDAMAVSASGEEYIVINEALYKGENGELVFIRDLSDHEDHIMNLAIALDGTLLLAGRRGIHRLGSDGALNLIVDLYSYSYYGNRVAASAWGVIITNGSNVYRLNADNSTELLYTSSGLIADVSLADTGRICIFDDMWWGEGGGQIACREPTGEITVPPLTAWYAFFTTIGLDGAGNLYYTYAYYSSSHANQIYRYALDGT